MLLCGRGVEFICCLFTASATRNVTPCLVLRPRPITPEDVLFLLSNMTAKQPFNGEVVSNLNKLKPYHTYLFDDARHRQDLVRYLTSLRRDATLCDVTLRHGKRKLACHRIILSAASPYFHALFVEAESGKFVKNVDVPLNIDAAALDAIIEYMYSGSAYLNPTNAIGVLKASCLFKLQALIDECTYALSKYVSCDNCLEIKNIALLYGQKDLHERTWRFICKNFNGVANSREFLELTEQILEKIIGSDDVRASEEQLFDSLVRWTNFNRNERGVHFAKLLRLVRLPLMADKFLVKNVDNEELVQRSPSAKEMVMEAMRYQMADEVMKRSLQGPRTVVRTWTKLKEVIMFVGGKGSSPHESRITLCYEPRENAWFTVAPLPVVISDHSIACQDDIMLCCGGSQEGKSSLILKKDVYMYDAWYNQWKTVAPMTEERAMAACGALQGLYFVVGGLTNGSKWNAVEVYNPINKKWTILPTPNIQRSNHALVTTETHIYAVGGDGYEYEPAISVERFEPVSDIWSFVLPMSCGKVGACAVGLDKRLLVIGGSNGYHTLKQCEAYDIEEHRWKDLAEMNEFRQKAEAAVIDNQVYVSGGRDFYGKRYLDTIERYDPLTNEWTIVTEIPIHKKGFKCVVMEISSDFLQPFRTDASKPPS